MTVLAAIRTPLIWISLIFTGWLIRNLQVPLSDEVEEKLRIGTICRLG